MPKRIPFVLMLFAIIFLSGCCAKFNDLTSGTTYHVGDIISSSRPDIEVKPFQWSNGTWTSSGTAEVDNHQYAQGSGNDLNSRNVNLFFLFDYPVDEFVLKFAELGGNNNIDINGDFRNVADLISLNGTTIGGVLVTVTAVQQGNNYYGEMHFEGNMQAFTIGGQELWLDDICRPIF